MSLLRRNLTALRHLSRRYVSALYITGDKAKETFSVLTPYLDFRRLQNVERLKQNLALRQLNLNLDELLAQWHLFDDIEQRKKVLERRRVEIAEQMKQFPKGGATQQTEQLRNEGKVVREDFKNLKEHSYSLEDVFVHGFLGLPNDLHEMTPTNGKEKVIFIAGQPPSKVTDEKSSDLVEWTSQIRYYLKGEAAKFDALLPLFAADFFKQTGFVQFSNPDFVRSILVEAAAIQPDSLHQLREEEAESKLNLLHLAGGGSPMSFLGYIAKLSLYPTALPLKFVANGKQYTATEPKVGLLDAPQTTCTQFFIATHGPAEIKEIQSALIEDLIRFYHLFGLHFRVISLPAHRLQTAESHRIAVEMYSPNLARYVEVGHISGYSDFISKRLLFNYREGKAYKFPHLLAGTVVNVERLLALMIEAQPDFRCPEFLTID